MSDYKIDTLEVETQIIAPAATTTVAGLQSPSDKTKLDSVESGATANDTDANLRDRSTHTGTQTVSTISDFNTTIGTSTQTALNLKYDASNPSGYETPAQLNTRDTNNRARVNHTGTQLASTISDFASSVLATVITGVSFVDSLVLVTDSILVAIGKLQGQITQAIANSSAALALKVDKAIQIINGYGITGGGDLSADRTLAVSLTHTEVFATNTITTTSATDVLMTNMTITPAAGTYLVLFKSTLFGANDDASITPSIYSGGVLETGSQSPVVANVSGGFANPNTTTANATCFAVVTVNGSQAIEGRWRRSAGTASASNRHLKIIRIA